MSLTLDAFRVLNKIEMVRSTNAKKQILMNNIDNNILFDILYWTYNPFYHYYMNKVDIPDNIVHHKSESISESIYGQHMVEFKQILGRLNARSRTGNNAKDMVFKFLEKCCGLEVKWYSKILMRDLRCGISVTTINNVYGSVIKTYPVALAENPDVRVYPPNFRIDEKFDGYRCLTEVDNKYNKTNVNMFSRNGNDLLGYDELLYIVEKCNPLMDGASLVLDGELMSKDFKGTQNNAFRKSGGKKANYYIFDIINKKAFYNVNGYLPLSERMNILQTYISLLKEKAKKLKIDTSCIVEVLPLMVYEHNIITLREDFAKAYKHRVSYVNPTDSLVSKLCDEVYSYALEMGLEGVIVKDLDSLYMEGKSYSSECIDVKRKDEKWYSWAKRKPVETLDLVVQDVYEGTGENKGRLGGVNVIYEASDGKEYLVGVGSGFKKEDRIFYWDNPNEIIGKTIEVHYDIETQDANGNYSLRFPRFKKVRKDK